MPFLSWTLSQACRQTKSIPGQLKNLYDRGCDASIPELENALEVVLERLDVLYVVIDAVDESSPRDDLLRLIATMVFDQRFQKVKILATSRPYLEIELVFSGISKSISMSNPWVTADIRQMVRSRLATSYRLKRWLHFHKDIEDTLVDRSAGMYAHVLTLQSQVPMLTSSTRFHWVECQIQAIERLRDISKLQSTLDSLPRDLAETYTRIIDEIPENAREFVRLVLIWVIGHREAPWISGQEGINADLLVSAVEHDLFGPGSYTAKEPRIFDVEYLRDLCACLLTFRPVPTTAPDSLEIEDEHPTPPMGGNDCTGYIVSTSHYSVVEFLQSSYIQNSQFPVSLFYLPPETIRPAFATSVLRQSLDATPHGTGTDWKTDREAYCLVLGCALDGRVEGQSEENDKIVNLLVQYLTPSNPHFCRFVGIQARIAVDIVAGNVYYLRDLPTRFFPTSTLESNNTRDDAAGCRKTAEALLTMLLLLSTCRNTSLMAECIGQLIQSSGRQAADLLQTKVSGSITRGGWTNPEDHGQFLYGTYEGKFEGTVREVVNRLDVLGDVLELAEF